MSTYYYLRCDRCKEQGGFFSRQAWGWGNADIIDTFKFLMAHAACTLEVKDGIITAYRKGAIELISEHDEIENDEQECEKWKYHRAKPEVMNMFPCSQDWKFVGKRVDDAFNVVTLSAEWLAKIEGE